MLLKCTSYEPKRDAAPKGEEPSRLAEDDFREDRLERLVRKAVEKGKITLSRAAEVLDVRRNVHLLHRR